MKEISISPNKILFGEETTIKLEGFDAEQEIELEAKFTSDDNKTYISRAIFRTNTEGKVQLSKIPLEYFEKTFEFLQNDLRTKDKKISIVAGSKGAELALLLASRYSFIHSVVAYVPSHVLWNGFGDYKQMKCSSWTHNGKELAFVQIKMKFMNLLKYFFSKQPLEFTSTYLYSLNNKIDNDAIIKVENIKGNILLISGTDDKMWCSALMGDKIMQRLEEHNFQYEYEHLSYEGAGHMITTPYFPAKHKEYSHPADNKTYALGGDMYADLKASEDSWKKVLAFLKK